MCAYSIIHVCVQHHTRVRTAFFFAGATFFCWRDSFLTGATFFCVDSVNYPSKNTKPGYARKPQQAEQAWFLLYFTPTRNFKYNNILNKYLVLSLGQKLSKKSFSRTSLNRVIIYWRKFFSTFWVKPLSLITYHSSKSTWQITTFVIIWLRNISIWASFVRESLTASF